MLRDFLPYIALPSSDGQRGNSSALLNAQRCLNGRVIFQESYISLLALNFNYLLCEALNLRKERALSHWVLLHSDVVPVEENWILTLKAEMDKVKADVLSAVLPIKDSRGLTSTALDTHQWQPRRLTMKEIMDRPATFTEHNLLVNTGCMMVRFDMPWVEHLRFEMRDEIVQDSEGNWIARVEPEDWNFSRLCHRLGLRVFATRAVRAIHQGSNGYRNDVVWGQEVDEQNIAVLS